MHTLSRRHRLSGVWERSHTDGLWTMKERLLLFLSATLVGPITPALPGPTRVVPPTPSVSGDANSVRAWGIDLGEAILQFIHAAKEIFKHLLCHAVIVVVALEKPRDASWNIFDEGAGIVAE